MALVRNGVSCPLAPDRLPYLRVPAGAYPAYLPSFGAFVADLLEFRDAVTGVKH